MIQEHNKSQHLEKKQKQIDKQITEWKSKYEEKEEEVDQARKETHVTATEVRSLLPWQRDNCVQMALLLFLYFYLSVASS